MVDKYRKKPVEIEAIEFDGTEDNFKEILKFMSSNLIAYEERFGGSILSLGLRTLEGTMNVSLYDYIIKGVEGEFYPCKPDIFNKTYEKVEN